MSNFTKRAIITLRPEWEADLDKLKKDMFYKQTQAEMFRYIIARGLDAVNKKKD